MILIEFLEFITLRLLRIGKNIILPIGKQHSWRKPCTKRGEGHNILNKQELLQKSKNLPKKPNIKYQGTM